MDEADDVYEDTISVNSESPPKGREYISLSRVTIYHSAQDLNISDESMAVEEDCTKLHIPSSEHNNLVEKPSVSLFNESNQTVDFVLAWSEPKGGSSTLHSNAATKREIFEKNLMQEGLCLEKETNKNLHFVKIHAPRDLLLRYTEILKLRMPMKHFPGQDDGLDDSFNIMLEVKSILKRLTNWVRVDPTKFKRKPHQLTAEFSRDKKYLFDVDSEDFFTPSVRSMVVDFILQREKFTEDTNSVFCFGINRLISEKVYSAAYPLHDGDYRKPGCLRSQLYSEWAAVSKWIMYQPVDYVKDYLGVKFGLYFAWLGFYTHMLIPASIVGFVCFIYGLSTMYSNNLSEDICNESRDIIMCPLCDRTCDYWNLRESCTYSRITHLFDNPFTVFFAAFMSFWATLFLELWKRYSADITHHWGLTNYDLQAEHPRPEYLARLSNVKRTKINVATKLEEPYVPFWKVRVPATILSFSVVLLLIAVAVGAVFGVVLYRMSVLAAFSLSYDSDHTSYMIMFIPITAAIINLVCILALNYVYDLLAVKLTEMELLRTQTEFDDSLTLKIYLFQFVNYYTSIFYIVFLKGKFVGYPLKYNRIFHYRQEECGPGGCLMELCIQLAIIMVGKQAMNTVLEMVIPFLMKSFNAFRIKAGLKKEDCEENGVRKQWLADYKLLDWGPRGLFDEYLEMVLQYGFVTIFVAAFPLAPFFALLNNVLEMRLDAKKFLRFYKRPVPHRVKNIGVWFKILDIIGRIAVGTNAFIIAFSSNFIPRLVYILTVSEDHTDAGFLEHSLAFFNTSDFNPDLAPRNPIANHSMCRYSEYRNPPDFPDPKLRYKRPPIYWHILAARLAFIVVFQNIVGFVKTTVQWLIPDMSRELRDEIKREAYLTNELIIQEETKRARGFVPGSGDFIKAERESLGQDKNHVRFRGHGSSDDIAEVAV